MLGLPAHITTCLFDLDGVLTDTASVHNAAWKQMFDEFLQQRANRAGEPFVPFDSGDDYGRYVDGRPAGRRRPDFLAQQGHRVARGCSRRPARRRDDLRSGNRKNAALQRRDRARRRQVYEGSRDYLKAAAAAGLRRVVVSSSANTEQVLRVTGLLELVEGRDRRRFDRGTRTRRKAGPRHLCRRRPLRRRAAPRSRRSFEDALAGVEAGSAGRFRIRRGRQPRQAMNMRGDCGIMAQTSSSRI